VNFIIPPAWLSASPWLEQEFQGELYQPARLRSQDLTKRLRVVHIALRQTQIGVIENVEKISASRKAKRQSTAVV
jgi:hypothetical protein